MGLYNNVPTFTYVSATGITVTYNKEVYTVQSFYTNKKYIYWDSDNATVLQASNTMPTRSFKTHLVIINDNGIANLVPSTDDNFEINYNGDSDEAVKARVYALYEKNKQLGNKFVAIEQDIDGIKQIVGSSENQDGTLIDRVSKVEQTAEDIKLSVNNIEKTYSDDKEITQLREDLNFSIINLNSKLGVLNSEISDYYKDNKISNEEKLSIETMLSDITLSKSEVLKFVNKVILIATENENTNGLNALNNGVAALENSHTNFIQNITVAISDHNITSSEKTVIIDAFAKYNLRINELKNLCDDIIFLGVGGIVSEQLAQITMNSNEIKLSINSVETNLSSDLSLQKAELKSQIEDISTSLGNFKNVVETTFKDGIIDEAEKKLLSEKLGQLEKEKLDIDAQFDDAYSNKFLVTPYNENLKVIHDEYASKHIKLKNKILEVINFTNITDADFLAIQTLFNEYSVVLSQLQVALNNAFDIITTNRANEEILKAKNELLKELEDANNKIDEVVENIDNYIGDGFVDSAEKKGIELNLRNLEKEKLDIDAQYNHWYSNSFLVDPLKTEYKNSYNNYISKYNNSVDIITAIINKSDLVNDTDRLNMLNAHNLLAGSLKSFVEKANQVIELVSSKHADVIKDNVQSDIDDVSKRLDNLDFVIDGTFENNIIDKAERKVLSQNLSDLELQKTDVDKQYEQLYKSPYLDGTLRNEFKTSYNNFIFAYDNLVGDIQYILSKSDLINDTDRSNISSAYSKLNTSFGSFISKSNEVIEYISKKQSYENIQNFDKELKDLNDKVDGILGDIDGALSDDVLDKTERMILENGLNDLEVQKNDVTSQYESILNNVNLTDTTIKENLTSSYGQFISSYNSLVNNIQYLLNKSGNITDGDKASYQGFYDDYKESVILFSESFYVANNFITNKTMNDLRDSFNAEISDLNNAISDLDETMNGIFKDGILSEAEKMSIREQLDVLKREKIDVDNNYNSVYSNSNLSSSLKTSLKSLYDSYVTSYNNLVSIINTILNKSGIISSTEQTSYKNALVTYRGALGTYSSKLKEAIDNITNNSINKAKNELQNEINDVINSIDVLETNMNEVFKDGVLSEAEKTTIRQQLQTLYKEKSDIDTQYKVLYANSFLVDSSSAKPKSELKSAYDNFISKYNSLITVIDTILNKTTIVDSSDRTKLETALSNYRTASSNYVTKSTNAIDSIAGKKATDESEKVNEKYAEILLSDDGIVNRVGSVETTVTTHTTQLGTVDSRINTAKNSAINTASSDATTKANNALNNAKSYTDGQITTVNKTITDKVAEIKTTTDSISLKVSNVETKTTTAQTTATNALNKANTNSTNISSLTTRMSTAESKITDSAIINTVTSTIENKVNVGVNSIQVGSRNFVLNGNFSDTVTGSTTDKHENIYPSYWGGYNGGVSNPTTSYHAHIDTVTFGYNVCEFNESNGVRNWKAINQNISERFVVNGKYRLSLDVYVTGTGTKIFGGFHYTKIGETSASFGGGQYSFNTSSFKTNTWQRVSIDVPYPVDVDTSKSITFYIYGYGFTTNSIVYIKNIALTQGTQTTDWTPAPEEVDFLISNTEKVLNSNIDNAISDAQSNILQNVADNYATVASLNTLSETVSSNMAQTSKDISMQFTTAQNYTKEVEGKLQQYQDTVSTNIRFSDNGIELGKTNSPFSTVLDNTKLAFKQNNEVVAYISNNKMNITDADVNNSLRIGKDSLGYFTWVQGSNGNLSLKWSDK